MHPTLRLKVAYLVMRQRIEQSVSQFGLTAAQFEVLQQLIHEDGLEHGELQRRLSIASPTLTNIIDVMVRQGHVDRRPDPKDGRARRIWLTQSALSLCESEAFHQAGAAFVDAMFAGFDPVEKDGFLKDLARVTRNLG